jgi:PAS domain S-box-containing protein
MFELEGQESMELGRELSGSQERSADSVDRVKRDRLLIAILSTALLLAVLVWGTAVIWGTGPVLASVPWYIPLVSLFIALVAILIGYMALGRYQVLRDPVSFWVGSGYLVYGLGQIFYALTWPGLLPNSDPMIGHLPSTSAWIALVDFTLLEAFLLTAVVNPWPGRFSLPGNQWLKPVFTFLSIAFIVFGLSILSEQALPVLVDDKGVFTSLQRIWLAVLLCFFVLSSTYSILYYQRSHDRLVGFIAFPQLALAFICMIVLLGGRRYDAWWYVHRVVLVGGHLGVLYGLLSEYLQLLKKESEGRRMLEAILENIPVGLAVTGGPPEFPIARISRHGLEMNGQESDVRIGSPTVADPERLKILLSNQDSEVSSLEEMPLYRASHFGEEIRNLELVMESPDGSKIPVLVNAAPIHDIQGNIVAAISTWLDITDRKLAEERLQASEALYRAIARSIPRGGIFVVDRNLRYVIAEGVIAEKFGASKEMIEGHTVPEIFDREVAAKMEARFHRAFEGETISYETEHNGRIYWTQHAVMDDPAGHAIVITMDVTERKQAEKALGESEQRFRAIINQATAGIVRTDIQGRSLFVNQAFCDMLGYTEAELVDEEVWKYIHPDDMEESRRLFDRLREKGKPFHLEERLIRKDGSILWGNVSAAPILDEVDKPRSVVFIVVDITERKNAEEALQKLNLELESRVETRTAELQSANWALFESRRRLQILSQRLVDVQEEERRAIARELHDRVGQTLTALNLNLTIVSDQLASQATGHITERLADSIKLVTEMISIVRDVMSDLRPIVLDEYGLEAALHAYLTKFESRYGIHVDFDRSNRIIPHLGAGIEMTILRIAQEALLNIARHAHADHVTLILKCDEETLLLSVEDNGVGIQSWHAPANGRSGHGLMLMRERAEAVGGTLKISSIPAKGTRIEVYLPYENSDENKAEKEGRS